jgi:hypothetical protein
VAIRTNPVRKPLPGRVVESEERRQKLRNLVAAHNLASMDQARAILDGKATPPKTPTSAELIEFASKHKIKSRAEALRRYQQEKS